MRLLIFAAALPLLLLSCRKDKDKKDECEDTYSYIYFAGKKIDTVRNYGLLLPSVTNGNSLVFQYTHTSNPCGFAIDAGMINYLHFEVPSNVNNFEYSDAQELKNSNCYFSKDCYCPNTAREARNVSGLIKGTRLTSNAWNIEIDVTEPNFNERITVKKIFMLQ